MSFSEEWIERKLAERLWKYKKRYPAFDIERFMLMVEGWDPKSQRWAPYMEDKHIKAVNVSARKGRAISRLSSLDNW